VSIIHEKGKTPLDTYALFPLGAPSFPLLHHCFPQPLDFFWEMFGKTTSKDLILKINIRAGVVCRLISEMVKFSALKAAWSLKGWRS
jgi:hypothetical protein